MMSGSVRASITSKGTQQVYVVDFAVYKPPEELSCGMYDALIQCETRHQQLHSLEALEFKKRVAEKSGEQAGRPRGGGCMQVDSTHSTLSANHPSSSSQARTAAVKHQSQGV
jgi:hypothetical protein